MEMKKSLNSFNFQFIILCILMITGRGVFADSGPNSCEPDARGWANCVSATANGNNLNTVRYVVINNIYLEPSDAMKFDHGGNDILLLTSDGQKFPVGTLAGIPSNWTDIRYDQQLTPFSELKVTQIKKIGQVVSSCYHKALNVCMKSSQRQTQLITNVQVGSWSNTSTRNSMEDLGETLGFFCCHH